MVVQNGIQDRIIWVDHPHYVKDVGIIQYPI